ncbi:hypothetical protein Axy10_082 [Achromobacter phage vB_AxyP_19-32_Axy10]|uniref:Uncharacterized protein n=1 Tax=Achromobacter phage vB_AxyP_19-32_Axy10 TaxID=2591041 RepID=A0A514CU22_9CAUD|nr:hypothetical protein KMC59_gp36 [Achromobacter phage vB_AxyP_19-32_Axy10]QDH83966.1 hypothetical protein Axy10_082 [Achromobacter phage vB_AxyP_19-32_Axy10]
MYEDLDYWGIWGCEAYLEGSIGLFLNQSLKKTVPEEIIIPANEVGDWIKGMLLIHGLSNKTVALSNVNHAYDLPRQHGHVGRRAVVLGMTRQQFGVGRTTVYLLSNMEPRK